MRFVRRASNVWTHNSYVVWRFTLGSMKFHLKDSSLHIKKVNEGPPLTPWKMRKGRHSCPAVFCHRVLQILIYPVPAAPLGHGCEIWTQHASFTLKKMAIFTTLPIKKLTSAIRTTGEENPCQEHPNWNQNKQSPPLDHATVRDNQMWQTNSPNFSRCDDVYIIVFFIN